MTKKDYNYVSHIDEAAPVSFVLQGTCEEAKKIAQQVTTCLFADQEENTLRVYGGGLVRQLASINNDATIIKELVSSIVNVLCYELINIYNKTELINIRVDSVESTLDNATIHLTLQTTYGEATTAVFI